MAILAGAPIAASDVLDLLPVTYTKTAVTSRNTTTTYTADPELASIALAVGTYEIELVLFYTVASTTPKLKTRWVFSGTWNTPIRGCTGPGSGSTGDPDAVVTHTDRGYVSDSQDATYNSSISGAYSVVREVARNVTVTVAGNLSLHWAQVTSNGSNVNVQAGTSFTIRKIS